VESRDFQKSGPAYVRVLGANGAGRELLARMRHTAALPVISRSSAGRGRTVSAKKIMDLEHRSTELWETLTESPMTRREAEFVPVMAD
jgi:hypothetical protein